MRQRAGGEERPYGTVTRGTTNPNRLRRFDRWLIHRLGPALTRSSYPLVVDLGYGRSPVTTLELADRLTAAAHRPVDVLGLEIDPARVLEAQSVSRPDVAFRLGGFEVPTSRPPVAIRAANVLRQYAESEVPSAWSAMVRRLAPAGILVEGTCDELGRLGSWVTLRAREGTDVSSGDPAMPTAATPESLTLGVDLRSLTRPSRLAERLPKALIHHNVPGEPIHHFLTELERAWDRAAGHRVFGPRQRWLAAAAAMRAEGWPIADDPARWRLGELTVAWSAVAPTAHGIGPRP